MAEVISIKHSLRYRHNFARCSLCPSNARVRAISLPNLLQVVFSIFLSIRRHLLACSDRAWRIGMSVCRLVCSHALWVITSLLRRIASVVSRLFTRARRVSDPLLGNALFAVIQISLPLDLRHFLGISSVIPLPLTGAHLLAVFRPPLLLVTTTTQTAAEVPRMRLPYLAQDACLGAGRNGRVLHG